MALVALPGGSGSDPVLAGAQAVEDFEQEVLDQYAPWRWRPAGCATSTSGTRAVVIEFARTGR